MALGGYKFAGYKCTKGSLSGTAFCLLMHKTRVKAFVESCAASGALWDFCKTDGTIDFEGTTGAIYQVDSDGYNYASFFQYGSEDKYLAILTLPNQTSAFNSSAIIYGTSTRTYSSNTYYFTMFHCASLTPFDDTQFFLNGHTYPSKSLELLPITNLYEHSISLATLTTSYSFYESANARGTTCYFGYATKGSKIITLASTSDLDYLSYGYVNATVIGYDAMTLSSASDTNNIFAAVMRPYRSGEIGWSDTSQFTSNPAALVLCSTGAQYNMSGESNTVSLFTSHQAITTGGSDSVPFSSVVISPGDNSFNQIRTTNIINADGIQSKGRVDIDFVSSNIRPGQSLADSSTWANGNFLLASRGNSSGANLQFYVGWDPSNPDITQESAWTAYTE